MNEVHAPHVASLGKGRCSSQSKQNSLENISERRRGLLDPRGSLRLLLSLSFCLSVCAHKIIKAESNFVVKSTAWVWRVLKSQYYFSDKSIEYKSLSIRHLSAAIRKYTADGPLRKKFSRSLLHAEQWPFLTY